jgi:group II intron reverse transcriptase/maturase
MPKEKQEKAQSVDNLRHTEYYGMQEVFDGLYAKAKNGESFTNLMGWILSRENILLAYRNIKTNGGSNTPGTDKITIRDIGRLSPEAVVEKVRFIVKGSQHGYRPKPVRRKDIPKPYDPTATRPLGIPCMWDRLVQQCIKQVLEPICEAKFSDNSYGFRPNRCVEHAIQSVYKHMQRSNLHYVIEFDIKGFFDNVNHSKLIKQMWAMGIRDKHLIWVIKQILKAPVRLPDGKTLRPDKGTPQGGIISPLLANIVLNELDHWVERQWQQHPVTGKYSTKVNPNGSIDFGKGYRAMKQTRLKEMFIVRYADDFRVFCRTKGDAERAKIAITAWLSERLKLEVSDKKTRIVNVKRRYSEFLGFKIRVHTKGTKQVVKSHMCDKAIKNQTQKLVEQAKRIAKPSKGRNEYDEIMLYNTMVMGTQNYYCIATHINLDCDKLQYAVSRVLHNRLRTQKVNRLRKTGRPLTQAERERYGKSRQIRFVAGTQEPIYPIAYAQHKNPIAKRRRVCSYTPEGRIGLHDNLRINTALMLTVMRQPLYGRSAEYADNRISLFSAQWGKCAVTGREFECAGDIHCHHKLPKSKGGTDKYGNLVLVLEPIHKLIHATDGDTIRKYLEALQLKKSQLAKVNEYRQRAGLDMIS